MKDPDLAKAYITLKAAPARSSFLRLLTTRTRVHYSEDRTKCFCLVCILTRHGRCLEISLWQDIYVHRIFDWKLFLGY
jgi:hypothetical protein